MYGCTCIHLLSWSKIQCDSYRKLSGQESDIVRSMEFKMERQGLLQVGQEVTVTESPLPTSYYYTIQPMIAMSKNYLGYERLKSRKGIVKDIRETDRGYYTDVEFDEEDIGN